jgi:hypothetical protein
MGRGPWYEVVPSIIVRETMPKPFPVVAGVVKTVEWREPAVRVSRIMMPALAQSFVFVWPVTRARISPSPVIRVWAKWKPSALKKMSSPEAVMVYSPLAGLRLEEPGTNTRPTSTPVREPDTGGLNVTFIVLEAMFPRPAALVTEPAGRVIETAPATFGVMVTEYWVPLPERADAVPLVVMKSDELRPVIFWVNVALTVKAPLTVVGEATRVTDGAVGLSAPLMLTLSNVPVPTAPE